MRVVGFILEPAVIENSCLESQSIRVGNTPT
jgi:hypothetical protein